MVGILSIRSHTALNNYELQGQVLETIVSVQTTDISPFVELLYYAWVKFCDNLAKYSELKEQLEQWLGPAVDIGPAITSEIFKSNGQVIYISTNRGLSDDELCDNDEVKQ